MLKETLNFKMRQCILQIHGIYLTHSRKSQTGRSFKEKNYPLTYKHQTETC